MLDNRDDFNIKKKSNSNWIERAMMLSSIDGATNELPKLFPPSFPTITPTDMLTETVLVLGKQRKHWKCSHKITTTNEGLHKLVFQKYFLKILSAMASQQFGGLVMSCTTHARYDGNMAS